MHNRDRLVDIILQPLAVADTSDNKAIATAYADRILSDGWMRPPCKSGDELYIFYPSINSIERYHVIGVNIGDKHDTILFSGGATFTLWERKYDDYFGKTIFFSEEEAVKARDEIGGIKRE